MGKTEMCNDKKENSGRIQIRIKKYPKKINGGK